jgi:hypothetical protein
VPVHAQVGDRPGLHLRDHHPGRAHGGDLAARGLAGDKSGDQAGAEVVAGPVLKRRQHGRGHAAVGQQVARGSGARGGDVRRLAQCQLAGVARRAAGHVDGRQLPVPDVRCPVHESRERVAGGRAAGHRVQQLAAQPGIGRALAAHRPAAGPDRRAPGRNRHARRGNDGADRARTLAPAHQRERHGLTATTVTSTSHSGRASADTTRPVNTGYTPARRRPSTRYTGSRCRMSVR